MKSGPAGLANVQVDERGPVTICAITGEVDISNVETVLAGLLEAASSDDATGVALDLTGTSYLDSAGIRILFEFSRRLRAARKDLRIVVPGDGIIRRVLFLTAIADIVPVHETLDDALRSMRAAS